MFWLLLSTVYSKSRTFQCLMKSGDNQKLGESIADLVCPKGDIIPCLWELLRTGWLLDISQCIVTAAFSGSCSSHLSGWEARGRGRQGAKQQRIIAPWSGLAWTGVKGLLIPSLLPLAGTPWTRPGCQSLIQHGIKHCEGWDGTSIDALGNLWQCLTTFTVKNFILVSVLNPQSYSIKPFPPVLLLADLPKWFSPAFLKTLLAGWGCARLCGWQQCPAPRCELTALTKTPFMTSLPLWKISSLPPCSLQPFNSSCLRKPGVASLRLCCGKHRAKNFLWVLVPYTSCLSSSLPVVFPYGAYKNLYIRVKSVTSFWSRNQQEINFSGGVGISFDIWWGFEAGIKWLHAIGRDTLHQSTLQQALSVGWPDVSWGVSGTALPTMKFSCQKIEHIWNYS